MIDFDSDVSIMQATQVDSVTGMAYVILPGGKRLDTSVESLQSLSGKMAWTGFVRDHYKMLEEAGVGNVEKIHNPGPQEQRDYNETDLMDPLEYALSQLEHYASECEELDTRVSMLEESLAEARKAYKKWKKIVEALESDE